MKRKIALILSIFMLAVSASSSISFNTSETVIEAASTNIDYYLDMSQLEGYATVSAYGTDTVTGGGNATIQVVTTTEEFINAVNGDSPAVVVVSGTIRCMTGGGSAINIGSNKTIVGIDENATLVGGINISGKSNIIISNLIMKGCLKQSSTPDDVINVQNGSHHIWFNHLDISDGGDGNLDIKQGADYITVSWCKFYYTDSSHDHRLSCLIGSGAGDHDDTDYNKLHITYHHNWFDDYVSARMPRIMYGRGHVYNNYYTAEDNNFCIGVDCYGAALIENNYFYKVNNPHQFMYDTNQMPCSINARGNIYEQTSGEQDNGHAPNKLGKVELMDVMPYAYWLDEAESVPEIVSKYAGTVAIDPNATPHPTAAPTPAVDPTAIPTAQPTLTPSPEPEASVNDNPLTFVNSEKGKAILFNGQNSDGSNAYLEFKNPFAGLELSEEPSYDGVYPVWSKGINISYWQYIPKGTNEAIAFSFNGYHRAIRDVDWIWFSEKKEAGYTNRFEDNGGTFSLVREADVLSGMQISTLGSFAFSEDKMTSIQLNPYSGEYGMPMNIQDKNYLYYNANTSGLTTALIKKQGEWHHVSYNITNDNIIMFVDGVQIGTDYYNYWGGKIKPHCSGQAYNLGTGWAEARRYSSESPMYSHGITLLDFVSLENTVFTFGGKAALRVGIGPAEFGTPEGVMIADIQCYAETLTLGEVKNIMKGEDIELDVLPLEEMDDSNATPAPSPDDNLLGDVDNNGSIDATDALLVLKDAAKLEELDEIGSLAADVNKDEVIDASDALEILKFAAKLIDSFE